MEVLYGNQVCFIIRSGRDDMSDLHYIDRHDPENTPPQPPLGEKPSLHPWACIRNSALGPWTAVGPRSNVSETQMSAYSYVVNDSDIIYSDIGKFCSIAAHVRINPGNHPAWRASQHHFQYRAASYRLGDDEAGFFDWRREQKVSIGHDVWIGHGAIVLAGVRVGNGSVIGAGAVVSKIVEPYSIVAGVPAKPIRRRFETGVANALEALAWWDWPHDTIRVALDDFRTLDVDAFIEKYR
jgi:phosphonate metabolism protein (transferase hexapeptide repeat family)